MNKPVVAPFPFSHEDCHVMLEIADTYSKCMIPILPIVVRKKCLQMIFAALDCSACFHDVQKIRFDVFFLMICHNPSIQRVLSMYYEFYGRFAAVELYSLKVVPELAQQLSPSDVTVSFDVVSLFQNPRAFNK